MHLGILALVKRPKDVDIKARSQRLVNIKVGDQRLADVIVKSHQLIAKTKRS